MRFYIDTEFNGFGGQLISMALVPEREDLPNFYCELDIKDQLHPWVIDNVVPHLFMLPVSYSEFQAELCEYLWKFKDEDIVIVADWPDDIRYFCESLITGPGERILMPHKIKFELDLSIAYQSEVPHNAYHDAKGIREYFKNIESKE